MGFNIKKMFKDDEEDVISNNAGATNEYYRMSTEEALKENDGNSRMILLEPRALSESYQIVDHIKSRNTVVVNLKRVTGSQAKRIIDVLSGAIYAIGGDIQKIGLGIFLLTPSNVNIQGKITNDKDDKDMDKEDLTVEW